MANLLTIIRVLLIFVVIGVWARKSLIEWWWLDLLMVALLAWSIFMDALDGWVARRRHEESKAGALFDIAGDRIVELVIWVFFAIRRSESGEPFVPFWIPVVIVTRAIVTDFIRSVAFEKGKTPFGMMETGWAKQLVSSRWSRAAYGTMKAVVFCALGMWLVFERVHLRGAWVDFFILGTQVLVYATTAFCILRALPVVWDGRKYFLASPTGDT